jgi:hypothetical protein
MKKITELNKPVDSPAEPLSKQDILNWYHSHTPGTHIPTEILEPSKELFDNWVDRVNLAANKVLSVLK